MKRLLFTLAAALLLPLSQASANNGLADIQQSPDQSHFIARMTADNNAGRILIVDAKAKKAITEFAKPRDAIIDWYRWVDNNRVVYQIKLQSDKADAVNGLVMVYAMDKDGSNRKQIFGHGLERFKRDTRINKRKEIKAQLRIVDTLPSEKKMILVAEYPLKREGMNNYQIAKERPVTVSRLDVYSGKRKTVKKVSFAEAQKLGS
ncbi:hypothetical protein [Pseudoteredinibacter isoporae]|uniref:Uncharacterized protein n=1 Tax=Pseudoteredinibacter isoporae TaxID=570281 RepID=A0A7X0JRN6_9GAMM|nr:hypothetical protein [Pseudoteredinibacter isoporae]MBB6521053.1 hypothetical protein [Pseudoteredinibacter isoporae]NHO86617.1 hypothetical protein [Pseudoteredinibacter isoporae]NIB24931.1 hypothetical protein [Pseudoteredinibacter isoporae]